MRTGPWFAWFATTALVLGCAEPRPPVRASAPEDPAAPTPPANTDAPALLVRPKSPAPTTESSAPPQIQLTRTEERTQILLVDDLEELLAFPGGVAWTQSGQVWAALDSSKTPTLVAELTDPHGLTTDGRTLYWVGHTENGQWDSSTGEVTPWPVFAGPSEQTNLAFGDALYGQDRMGVWRFVGRDGRRLPFRIEQGWRVLGFRAGSGTVVLGVVAIERRPSGARAHTQYVRVRRSGETTIIPSRSKPSRQRWDVNAAGDLAFIQGSPGIVSILKAKRKKVDAVLTEPGITTLCFCGPELCTVAGGELRRHAGATVERVAEVGDVGSISCTAQSVAWSGLVDGRVQISVQALGSRGSGSPATNR